MSVVNAIAIGSIVRLRSGGPPMTVYALEEKLERQKVYCQWFLKDSSTKTEVFDSACVEIVGGGRTSAAGDSTACQ